MRCCVHPSRISWSNLRTIGTICVYFLADRSVPLPLHHSILGRYSLEHSWPILFPNPPYHGSRYYMDIHNWCQELERSWLLCRPTPAVLHIIQVHPQTCLPESCLLYYDIYVSCMLFFAILWVRRDRASASVSVSDQVLCVEKDLSCRLYLDSCPFWAICCVRAL